MVSLMKKAFCSLALLILCLTACANRDSLKEDAPKAAAIEVKSRMFFQQWNTKGIGEPRQDNTILIIPEEFKTDTVTIVRLSDGQKVKEVYYKDKSMPSDDTWVFTADNSEDKTLVHQFASTYMITQQVLGKDGGLLKERFEIPNNKVTD